MKLIVLAVSLAMLVSLIYSLPRSEANWKRDVHGMENKENRQDETFEGFRSDTEEALERDDIFDISPEECGERDWESERDTAEEDAKFVGCKQS